VQPTGDEHDEPLR